MIWFKRKPEDPRQKLSREQMAVGGLPLNAQDRLREIRESPSSLFTSNLSVNEFVLAASEKMRPLGQVMGSTIYRVSWQPTPYYNSDEMRPWATAQSEARKLALGRIQQEAALLGAHGVIGVRLEMKAQGWGQNLLEFTVRGTAVAIGDSPPPQYPFVCSLSGQEFWALHRSGYRPVGVAFGACAYYQVGSQQTRYLRTNRRSLEVTEYTAAVYRARQLAMERLGLEAARVTAEGVVGVTVETDVQPQEVEGYDPPRRDLIVYFTAIGTAIKSSSGHVSAIENSLPLNG